MIHAGLDGIKRNLTLPEAMDIDLFNASEEVLKDLTSLPQNLEEAWEKAVTSEFIREILPSNYLQNHR